MGVLYYEYQFSMVTSNFDREENKMENEFEFDEEYPEMSDAQARDVYNDMCLYIDGYIYPWIK